MSFLALPAWKFIAIVEGWLFANSDPDRHTELLHDLSQPVDFTWIKAKSVSVTPNLQQPSTWQSNEKGASLISGRRKKRRAEE